MKTKLYYISIDHQQRPSTIFIDIYIDNEKATDIDSCTNKNF